MIELRRYPRRRAVADFTTLGESLLRVIGIIRALIIFQVARHTRLSRQVEISIRVALVALQGRVCPGQGEAHHVVIEGSRLPGRSRVALLAILRHSQRYVIWIVGLLEIRHVAAHAIRGRALEPAADMAGRALQGRVHPRQGETGELQVVKVHVEPRVHVVTLLARRRESRCHVARARRLLEILRMAGVTLRRHRGVITQGPILVAGIAVQRRVRSHQGEAVVVVLDRLYRNIPAVNAMTLLTARPHLAAMNIGVALGALRPHVGKNRLDMTLRAHNSLVHAAQGKLGLIVIELRNTADRFPAQRGMAIRAWQIQRSMRAARLRVHLPLSLGGICSAGHQH